MAIQSKLDEKERERARLMLNASIFMSVTQACTQLQTEPLLIRNLCNGDVSRSARMLANSSAAAGVIELFVNQGTVDEINLKSNVHLLHLSLCLSHCASLTKSAANCLMNGGGSFSSTLGPSPAFSAALQCISIPVPSGQC
jgi:hypothetical protein